jgi:hypothetical protein
MQAILERGVIIPDGRGQCVRNHEGTKSSIFVKKIVVSLRL